MMLNKVKTVSMSAILSIGVMHSAFAAVPHSFSADTPAVAAEVNANFDALDSRVTNLENSGPGTGDDFSGYSAGFSADGAPKNVVVLRRDRNNGDISYNLRIFYANSTETVSIDGSQVVRQFIANYAGATTDGSGTLLSANSWIETPDTSDYINFNIEQADYDPASLVKTVTDDTRRESWLCGGSGGIANCLATATKNATGDLIETYGWSQVRVLSGPLTINGMTFNDVRIRKIVGNDNIRVEAKGIGEILRSGNPDESRRIIYYQANGTTGGSLAGTPFEPGGSLDGLFF